MLTWLDYSIPWSAAREANRLFGRDRSSLGDPLSMIVPSSMTITWSKSIMVAVGSRWVSTSLSQIKTDWCAHIWWAIATTVQPDNSVRIISPIFSVVSGSKLQSVRHLDIKCEKKRRLPTPSFIHNNNSSLLQQDPSYAEELSLSICDLSVKYYLNLVANWSTHLTSRQWSTILQNRIQSVR